MFNFTSFRDNRMFSLLFVIPYTTLSNEVAALNCKINPKFETIIKFTKLKNYG